jgi:Uma2 family endonuclease
VTRRRAPGPPPPPDTERALAELREQFRAQLERATPGERNELFSRMGGEALYAPVFFSFALEGAAMPPTDLEPPAPGPAAYPRVTPRAYLLRERAAEDRSEYYDGEVVAMAGASERHVAIAQNISAHLYFRLPATCRVYQSDLKVQADCGAGYVYPDVLVLCGNPRFVDRARDVVTNPTVVFEVLSPGTERADRTRKARLYRGIASLRAYVLVSQEEPRVELYERGEDGEWPCTLYHGLHDVVSLGALGCELSLAEVYRQVFATRDYRARTW